MFRDGAFIARLAPTARTYDDFDATPGQLVGFDGGASIELADGIEVEWSAPSGAPGSTHTYLVRGAAGDSSAVDGARLPPRLLGFSVERGDAGWSFDAGESFWLDGTTPPPQIAIGNLAASATPNDQTTSVVLQALVDAGRQVVPVRYRLIAHGTAGTLAEVSVSGSRGGQRVEYQWQRSAADSPAAFSDLPYVHGLTWLDRDAVLSEGRYYRVAARVPGQEWISAPVRAELRTPVKMVDTGNGRNALILRDDGVSLSLRYPRPPVQFPQLLEFFSYRGLACGLLYDAGIECENGNGGLVSLNLPAAQSAVGTDETLWLGLVDGGVDRYGSSALNGRVDLLDASRVVAGNDEGVCGRRADGGVRCQLGVSPHYPATEVPPRFGFWLTRFGRLNLSDERGNTEYYFPSGQVLQGRLPVEDAGYVGGSENNGECGLRSDGLVRCLRAESRSFAPPVSPERYSWFVADQLSRCGLTRDQRVRCLAMQLPHVPPAPPVKDFQVQFTELVVLLDDGLIDSRGLGSGIMLQESANDRFVAFSRDWMGLAGQRTQCGLRADGVALCGGVTVPPNSRYTQITSTAGLLVDGGVESFVGPQGPSWPGTPVIELQEHPEAATTCARFVDGGRSCSPAAALPAEPLASVSVVSPTRGCGLTIRGQLRCWPDPPPDSLRHRRFRHVSFTASHLCGTSLDGEVHCVSATGAVLPPLQWDDFVRYEEASRRGCGLRRDGNVACRPVPSGHPYVGLPPWSP